MKVQDINMALREMQQPHAAERQEAAIAKPDFHRQLTTLSDDGYRKHIADLIDRIDKQGEILGKRADITQLQRYRGLIAELMNETVSNGYAFAKNSAFDARGRHRVYAMIKRVNEDLDLLAEEVLNEQADNLRVLDLVDDIRGLLVDIYL